MFESYLKALQDSLDIPYPERSEVLAEIGSHLEQLYDEGLNQGLSGEEARGRALAVMATDDEFVGSMEAVHQTAVARALARLPRSVSLGIEFGAIGLLGGALFTTVLVKEAQVLQVIQDGGPFMIAIVMAGFAIVVLGIERGYSLFIKKDHSAGNLKKRLLSLRFLGMATAITGVLGTLLGFYTAFGASKEMGAAFPIYEVAKIAMSTTIAGLTMSLLALLAYFMVQAWAERIGSLRHASR